MATLVMWALAVAVPLGPAPPKKLIQWGVGSPDPRQFRDQIDTFEKSPFDGTIISVTGMPRLCLSISLSVHKHARSGSARFPHGHGRASNVTHPSPRIALRNIVLPVP